MVAETDYQKTLEYYKHLSLFWTDIVYLMASKPAALTAAGPMRKFAMQAKKLATEMIEANEDLIEFNTRLAEYYKQLSDTWIEAQKIVNKKIPEIPQDKEQLEASKRVWIDIFENDFTQLFDSPKFGENFGKLISSELELSKHWNNMLAVLLETANVPTKNDIDDIYKEIHSLRKRISNLEKNVKQPRVKHNGK
ncbi:MAG: poly(R)-hydroxyalkanoic acid synthase subunit PhaE [Nitrosopumilaceae archaeon]